MSDCNNSVQIHFELQMSSASRGKKKIKHHKSLSARRHLYAPTDSFHFSQAKLTAFFFIIWTETISTSQCCRARAEKMWSNGTKTDQRHQPSFWASVWVAWKRWLAWWDVGSHSIPPFTHKIKVGRMQKQSDTDTYSRPLIFFFSQFTPCVVLELELWCDVIEKEGLSW